MAKSKPTSSAKRPKSAAPRNPSAAANDGLSAPVIKAAAKAAAPRLISPPEIGRVAGDVWALLDRDGAQTVAAIKKSVDAHADIVMAAIGWLAREDKLEFAMKGRQLTISLR